MHQDVAVAVRFQDLFRRNAYSAERDKIDKGRTLAFAVESVRVGPEADPFGKLKIFGIGEFLIASVAFANLRRFCVACVNPAVVGKFAAVAERLFIAFEQFVSIKIPVGSARCKRFGAWERLKFFRPLQAPSYRLRKPRIRRCRILLRFRYSRRLFFRDKWPRRVVHEHDFRLSLLSDRYKRFRCGSLRRAPCARWDRGAKEEECAFSSSLRQTTIISSDPENAERE